MKLKEFETYSLLQESGITLPPSILLKSPPENLIVMPWPKVVVKAQTLMKKRAKRGLVKRCSSLLELSETITSFFSISTPELVSEILLQEYIEHTLEYYLGFSFDTTKRAPVLLFSKSGGVDIEEMWQAHPENVVMHTIDSLTGISEEEIRDMLKRENMTEYSEKFISFIRTAYHCFEKNDLSLLELNPIIITSQGEILPLDANATLDDSARARHTFSFPERTGFRQATEREKLAHEIDNEDYRGTAGKTYIDLDGDIAILASGGGASLVALDALMTYGGAPANYTEYSGNPPAEKVKRLTNIVLSKQGLSGCWVVGGTANFTDIYETLQGFAESLLSLSPKPDYPIVIRRAGPRDREAFEMLKSFAEKNGFDMHFYDENTPITSTANIIVDLSSAYKKRRKVHGDFN